MNDSPVKYDFDRVFRLLLTIGLLVGTVWLLAYLQDVLIPFAIALLLAYLLNPIVDAFESKTQRRGWAVTLTLLMFGLLIATAVPMLAVIVIREAQSISEVLADPRIKAGLLEHIDPIVSKFEDAELQTRIRTLIEGADPQQLEEWVAKAVQALAPKLWNLSAGLVGFVGGLISALLALSGVVIILLYLIFLMLDFNTLRAHWKDQLPPPYRSEIVAFVDEFSLAMRRYFRGQFLVALCCSVLFAIGFKLLGLRMAVMLGLVIGMMNMVPYLQIVGLVPAVLLGLLKAFETGGGVWGHVVGVLVVFVVVQLIQDAFLVPKIMGKSTGLKPWIILLAIFIWGKLLGVLGLILAIPLSCLGLAYYRRFILGHHRHALKEGA